MSLLYVSFILGFQEVCLFLNSHLMSYSTPESEVCRNIKKKDIESHGDSIHSGKKKIEPIKKLTHSAVDNKY